MFNLLRLLGGFLTGYFVSDTGIAGSNNRPNLWVFVVMAFLGFLIFREINK